MDKKRKLWIDAGMELISQKGKGYSITELANETGMKRAGFYYHFSDFEDFFQAVIDHALKQYDKFRQEIIKNKDDWETIVNLGNGKYKALLRFTIMIAKFSYHDDISGLYDEIKKGNDQWVIPAWVKYHEFENVPQTIQYEIFDIIKGAWYMSLTEEDFDDHIILDKGNELVTTVKKLCDYGWYDKYPKKDKKTIKKR